MNKKNSIIFIFFILIIILMIGIFINKKNNNNMYIDDLEMSNNETELEIMSEMVVYNEVSKQLEKIYIYKQPVDEDAIENDEYIENPVDTEDINIEENN